jgi:hypothetical protein
VAQVSVVPLVGFALPIDHSSPRSRVANRHGLAKRRRTSLQVSASPTHQEWGPTVAPSALWRTPSACKQRDDGLPTVAQDWRWKVHLRSRHWKPAAVDNLRLHQERRLADQNSGSWNRMVHWLGIVEALTGDPDTSVVNQ